MPKLRDDLLRNMSPDNQELMKKLKKRPLKAYTLQELLPKKSGVFGRDLATEMLLQQRLDELIKQGLVIKMPSEGEAYYAKSKGRAPNL